MPEPCNSIGTNDLEGAQRPAMSLAVWLFVAAGKSRLMLINELQVTQATCPLLGLHPAEK